MISRQKGFSLIELLVVISIVGIMSGLVLSSIGGGSALSILNEEYEITYQLLERELDDATNSGKTRVVEVSNTSFKVKDSNSNSFNIACDGATVINNAKTHIAEGAHSVNVYQCISDTDCTTNITASGVCIIGGGGVNGPILINYSLSGDNPIDRWLTIYSTGLIERGTPQNLEGILIL
jgi:prepilin-type N-terminal cleavage/methylation domain-containing protein